MELFLVSMSAFLISLLRDNLKQLVDDLIKEYEIRHCAGSLAI